MARTVEELDREVDTLKAEVERLKQQHAAWSALVRQFAGCFTDDADWAAIHEKIEEARREPDPEKGAWYGSQSHPGSPRRRV